MKHIFKKLHIGSNHEPHRSNETPPSPLYTSDNRTSPGNSPFSPPLTSSSPASTVAATTISSAVNNSTGRTDYFSSEEEFQVQLALAISASDSEFKDDHEKDEIRAATLLSLGGNHHHRSDMGREKVEAAADALSRQYWIGEHIAYPSIERASNLDGNVRVDTIEGVHFRSSTISPELSLIVE